MNKLLALAPFLVLGLTACGEPVSMDGAIVKMESAPERVSEERRCNGAPTLLICKDVEVTTPAYWTVQVEASTAEVNCYFSLDEATWRDLTVGDQVHFSYSDWSGKCSNLTQI